MLAATVSIGTPSRASIMILISSIFYACTMYTVYIYKSCITNPFRAVERGGKTVKPYQAPSLKKAPGIVLHAPPKILKAPQNFSRGRGPLLALESTNFEKNCLRQAILPYLNSNFQKQCTSIFREYGQILCPHS